MNTYSIFFLGIEYICTQRNTLPHGVEVHNGLTQELIGICEGADIPEEVEADDPACTEFETQVSTWLSHLIG